MINLKSDLKRSNLSAYAEGSRRNLRVHWETFLLFCLYFKLQFLPVDTYTLQLYAQFLSRSFKSTNSIRNYISGVRVVHRILGFSLESINSFLVNLTLKGIARLNPYCVRQASPITPDILYSIYLTLDFSHSDDVVFWCLFLFAFFLVARKSNLVPTSLSDIKKGHCLCRNNVEYFGDNLLVRTNWSKTIQFRERELKTPLLKLQDSVLCPVQAFTNLCKVSKLEPKSPLFLLDNGKPITYTLFQKKLKSCIEKIGLNPDDFSSHSFRRGFATFAFRERVSSDTIQILGDWKSDAYKNYIGLSIDDKLGVIKSLESKLTF